MTQRVHLVAVLAFVVLTTPGTWAATYYYDSAATGSNNGTSWANAFTSGNSDTWTGVTSGDTVYIKQGTHNDQLLVKNETGVSVLVDPSATDAAIFLLGGQAYYSTNCTIDGTAGGNRLLVIRGRASGGTATCSFWVRQCSGLTLRGLEIEREDDASGDTSVINGITVQNTCTSLLFENLWIHHHSGDGINLAWTDADNGQFDRHTVRDCTIENIGDDGVQLTIWGLTIEGCIINKNGYPVLAGHPDGVQMSGTGFGSASYGKLIVRDSEIAGFTQGVFTEYAAGEVRLYNNVVRSLNGSGTGMVLSVHSTWTTNDSFIVANNVFYNFTWYGAILGGGTLSTYVVPAGGDVAWSNNIFSNCKYICIFDTGGALLDASNFYWDETGVQWYTSDGNPASLPGNRNVGLSTNESPAFVAVGSDWRLSYDSACRAAGVVLNTWFAEDRAGVTRGAEWDAGAYEYETPQASPTAPNTATLTALRNIGATIAWTDASDNEEAFEIDRSTDNSNWTQVASVSANSTSYEERNLPPGTTYYYRVRAVNGAGDSTNATPTPASITTGAPAPVRRSKNGGAVRAGGI